MLMCAAICLQYKDAKKGMIGLEGFGRLLDAAGRLVSAPGARLHACMLLRPPRTSRRRRRQAPCIIPDLPWQPSRMLVG